MEPKQRENGFSAAREALERIFGKPIQAPGEKPAQPTEQPSYVTFPRVFGEQTPHVQSTEAATNRSGIPFWLIGSPAAKAPGTSSPQPEHGGHNLPPKPVTPTDANHSAPDTGGTSVPPIPPKAPRNNRRSSDPRRSFWNWKLLFISAVVSSLIWGSVYLVIEWNRKERDLQRVVVAEKEQLLVRVIPPPVQVEAAPQPTLKTFIPHVASGASRQPAATAPPQPGIWEKTREFLPDCPVDSCTVVGERQIFIRKVPGEQYIGFNAPTGAAYAVKIVGKLNTCASTHEFGEIAMAQNFGAFVENDRPTDCNAWLTQQRGDAFEVLTDGGIVHLHYVMR